MTAKPSPSDLDVEQISQFRLLVVRLERRIRQQSEAGLTPTQLSALSVIERRGRLRFGDLARCERINKSSVTRLVDKLEARGLVATTVDPVDRRGSLVSITPRGRSLLDESRQRVDSYLVGAMSQLSRAERQTIYRAIPVLESLLETK